MSQFEGAGGLETPHLYSIAQSLKKIQEEFHSVTRGFGKIRVDNFSHEDREREAEEREQFRKEATSELGEENSPNIK